MRIFAEYKSATRVGKERSHPVNRFKFYSVKQKLNYLRVNLRGIE